MAVGWGCALPVSHGIDLAMRSPAIVPSVRHTCRRYAYMGHCTGETGADLRHRSSPALCSRVPACIIASPCSSRRRPVGIARTSSISDRGGCLEQTYVTARGRCGAPSCCRGRSPSATHACHGGRDRPEQTRGKEAHEAVSCPRQWGVVGMCGITALTGLMGSLQPVALLSVSASQLAACDLTLRAAAQESLP